MGLPVGWGHAGPSAAKRPCRAVREQRVWPIQLHKEQQLDPDVSPSSRKTLPPAGKRSGASFTAWHWLWWGWAARASAPSAAVTAGAGTGTHRGVAEGHGQLAGHRGDNASRKKPRKPRLGGPGSRVRVRAGWEALGRWLRVMLDAGHGQRRSRGVSRRSPGPEGPCLPPNSHPAVGNAPRDTCPRTGQRRGFPAPPASENHERTPERS